MADREEIKAKLEELEIEYDGRMSTENLEKLLPDSEQVEEHPMAGIHRMTKTESPKTLPFRVLRDFWPTDNDLDRVRRGEIVEMTAEEAIDGISNGALQKAY